jgi:hypothetical protein
MAGAAARNNAIIVAVGVIAAVIALVVWRVSAASLSPEAERVQKALLQQGLVTPDPALLPTESGESARLWVRGSQRSGALESCVITVGASLDEVQVTECTPVSP